MTMQRIAIGALLCVLFMAGELQAEWRTYRRCEVQSREQHTLRFDYWSQGSLSAWLVLKKKLPGAFGGKSPLYRVDDGRVHAVADMKRMSTDKAKESWIAWEVWDGKGDFNAQLLEFMGGRSVTFQYYLADGTIYETTFPLHGARQAIGEIVRCGALEPGASGPGRE